MRVVVVGSFNVDHVWTAPALPAPGETLAGSYRSGPGGKGFNQAVAAARSGAHTTFVCALGADMGGQLARALAAAEGIDLRDAVSDAPTGTAGILVDGAGRNSIVVGAGANATLSTTHVDAQRACIASAAVVLLQLESPMDVVEHALRIARDAGCTAMLNPAPANASISHGLLAACDLLTPNETEFCALLARNGGPALDPAIVAQLDDRLLHAHCRILLPRGTVVVTLGAAGCFVSHAAATTRGDPSATYRVAAPSVEVVDTTGAGDAFNGALASSLAQQPGANFAEHMAFAVHYASQSTALAGASEAMPRMHVVVGAAPA